MTIDSQGALEAAIERYTRDAAKALKIKIISRAAYNTPFATPSPSLRGSPVSTPHHSPPGSPPHGYNPLRSSGGHSSSSPSPVPSILFNVAAPNMQCNPPSPLVFFVWLSTRNSCRNLCLILLALASSLRNDLSAIQRQEKKALLEELQSKTHCTLPIFFNSPPLFSQLHSNTFSFKGGIGELVCRLAETSHSRPRWTRRV